jgi:hypothetical protein
MEASGCFGGDEFGELGDMRQSVGVALSDGDAAGFFQRVEAVAEVPPSDQVTRLAELVDHRPAAS